MHFDLIIKNGTVIRPDSTFQADIGVADGKIAALLAPGAPAEGDRTLDAAGKLVTPGAVDIHVHLEMDAGDFRSTDDFYTGTRAAAFGGTTTVFDFVEPGADESLGDALAARKEAAAAKAVVDYGFHMTIGPNQLDKLQEIHSLRKAGIGSCKLYMAYDLALRDAELLTVLEAVRNAGGTAIVHAENWDIITALQKRFISEGKTEAKRHPESRPASFEAEAINRIITIAEYAAVPLHIFHISCREGIDLVTKARDRGLAVTAETCPQYLALSDEVYSREGFESVLPVCAPPVRGIEQQRGLWEAMGRKEIHIISSDHCPFTREEKFSRAERFDTVPGGVPSIELRYPLIYSLGVARGRITPQDWVRTCCTAPARLLGIEGKGDIAPGYDADVVVFDPTIQYITKIDALHEAADWSPYEGIRIQGKVETVISRGEIIIRGNTCTAEAGRGRFLHGHSKKQ